MLIENIDALLFLKTLDNKSVDLILTDPPYIISKDSGMNKHYNVVAKHNEDKIDVKTEEDWIEYKKKLDKPKEELDNDKGDGWSKENYIKYGTILGKKYATQTKFGEWDENFTMEALEEIMKEYYSKLKHSGTLIIWFDIWKITPLKELMEKVGFKQKLNLCFFI